MRSSSTDATYVATCLLRSSASHPSSGASRSATSCGHRGGVVAGQQARPGAATQHVVDGACHLVASGVHRLGAQVGQPGNEGPGQVGVALGHGQHGPGLVAVAVGEVADHVAAERGDGVGLGHEAVVPVGPAQPEPAGAAVALRPLDGPGPEDVGEHLVDGVGGHLAVGGELAAGDGHHAAVGGVGTLWRRDRSAVRPDAMLATRGRSPAHVPDDVVASSDALVDPLMAERR